MSGSGLLGFDPSIGNQARIYDYLLNGKDNYAADRRAAEAALKAWPALAFAARANRAFHGRAVRYLAGRAGIRQFLDIGTGIPRGDSTHETAQAIAPEARVAYADYDQVVLAHAQATTDSTAQGATSYTAADLRDTEAVLSHASRLLDFSRPAAVILTAVLHVIPDADDPHAVTVRLLEAVSPGSYLVISHLGADLLTPDQQDALIGIAGRMTQQALAPRTREQVAGLFHDATLARPGLVEAEQWRPAPALAPAARWHSSLWSAVARKQ